MRRLLGLAAWSCIVVLGWASPATAEVPIETFPECGTPDRPDLCPVDLGERWQLVSYIRDDWADHVRAEELAIGSGCHADRAWQRTTGRWDAVVAVLDSGIDWRQDNVLRKHWLNAGELPFPRRADGSDAGQHDLDGNGVFNIVDWAEDPRIDWTAGVDDADDMLDPSDLIHGEFGGDWDGVDNDGNGYVDDISGWDFFWNDNDPYDEIDFGHGYWEAREVAAEGGDGGSIGVCLNCAILNLRVGDSFVVDGNHYAQALIYAVDQGAVSVNSALGAMTNSSYVAAANDYAWDHGVVVSGSAADEAAFHVMFPAGNHHGLYVNNVRFNADDESEATSFLQMANCTNYGVRVDVTAANTGCSSRAVSIAAGAIGLVVSAARGADGVEPLDPPLSGAEIYQIVTTSVDDVHIEESYGPGADPTFWPMREGWDGFSGYGRVNARAAVDKVLDRHIPPEVDILEPAWFTVVDPERTDAVEVVGFADARRAASYDWSVQIAAGFEPEEGDWIEVAAGTDASAPLDGVLATFDPADVPLDPAAPMPPITEEMTSLERAMRAQIYTAWVRVVVVDDGGERAEMRRSFFVHHDPDLVDGWPLRLGASMEASPALYDLDGDGDFEVVLATSDGELLALQHDGAALPGWPVSVDDWIEDVDAASPDNHLDAPAYASGAISSDIRQAIVSTPAIGDLDGDGEPEIVVATMGGMVFVYGPDGALRDGFPVAMDWGHIEAAELSADNDLDYGFFGSPALGDLDGDGTLEIVAPGMDQHVYAWRHDGALLSGWPVLCQFVGASGGLQGDRIVSSPAIGDLDGDGSNEVVVGSNESINTSYGPLYAIHGDGNDHAGGPYVEGFPVTMPGFYSETLPYVGEGSVASPALSDLDGDGDLEIFSSAVTDWGSLYDHTGERILVLGHFSDQYGPANNARDDTTILFSNSPAFADMDGDGVDEAIDGGLGIGYITAMAKDWERVEFDHFINVWDVSDGLMKRGFPQQMEGLQFFHNPAVADLDGDGLPEVINGSGEYLLHAFDVDGQVPAGWPKFTGQWLMASPAVGDLDGDGYLEVVQASRMGDVFVWTTDGPADGVVLWSSFHHDPANTGNATLPLPTQAGPLPGDDDDSAGDDDDGCDCRLGGDPAGPPLAAIGLLTLGLLVRRAGRRAGVRRA